MSEDPIFANLIQKNKIKTGKLRKFRHPTVLKFAVKAHYMKLINSKRKTRKKIISSSTDHETFSRKL